MAASIIQRAMEYDTARAKAEMERTPWTPAWNRAYARLRRARRALNVARGCAEQPDYPVHETDFQP